MVELVDEVETLVAELLRKWTGSIFHTKGPRFPIVFVSTRLGANQFPELGNVGAGEGGRMQSGQAASFTDVAD